MEPLRNVYVVISRLRRDRGLLEANLLHLALQIKYVVTSQLVLVNIVCRVCRSEGVVVFRVVHIDVSPRSGGRFGVGAMGATCGVFSLPDAHSHATHGECGTADGGTELIPFQVYAYSHLELQGVPQDTISFLGLRLSVNVHECAIFQH